jgi:hypothetical protein
VGLETLEVLLFEAEGLFNEVETSLGIPREQGMEDLTMERLEILERGVQGDGLQLHQKLTHADNFTPVSQSQDEQVKRVQDESMVGDGVKGLNGSFKILDGIPVVAVLVVDEADQVEPDAFIK